MFNLFRNKKQSPTLKIYHDEFTFNISITIKNKLYPNVMKCVLDRSNNSILIGDINVADVYTGNQFDYLRFINKGYGSMLMNELLAFAKENGYNKITGELADIDEDNEYDREHRERQIHFYKKFGFEILPDEEHPQTIELKLK